MIFYGSAESNATKVGWTPDWIVFTTDDGVEYCLNFHNETTEFDIGVSFKVKGLGIIRPQYDDGTSYQNIIDAFNSWSEKDLAAYNKKLYDVISKGKDFIVGLYYNKMNTKDGDEEVLHEIENFPEKIFCTVSICFDGQEHTLDFTAYTEPNW